MRYVSILGFVGFPEGVSLTFSSSETFEAVPLHWYRPKAINSRLDFCLAASLCAVSVAKEPLNAGNTSEQL